MPDDNTLDLGKPDKNDPIERYLNEAVGQDANDESDTNVEAQAGDKTGANQDGKELVTDKKPSTGDNKDGDGKQAPVKKGEEDKSKGGAAGDLTLPDGVVVKAGAERRFYEKARLAESHLSMKQNELSQANQVRDRLQQELTQLKTTVSSLNGADPQVVSVGLKLVKDLQRDPTGTLKALLTEALAAGYTIEGIGAGIDAQSVRAEVLKQFEPLQQRQQQMQQEEQTNQAIEQEVTGFYNSFPDARIHDDLIAQVIAKNPQLTLSEAYYQLKSAAIDRNLDWSKPLAPQIAGEQQQQQQEPQKKPMTNGRGPQGDIVLADADRTVVAHESTDMGSIIKAAMRDNGMKI